MAVTSYKTPGVYVEEISTLPPSVADVSTAVPAFLGYTEKGGPADEDGAPQVKRISSMLEYEQWFGGPSPTPFTVTVAGAPATISAVTGTGVTGDRAATTAGQPAKLLWYCLKHYFDNGGGRCYVVSVGKYTMTADAAHFEKGLAALEAEDEPTLILLTDAINLATYHAVCQKALAQCKKLGDRFAILDVKDGDYEAFRDAIGTKALEYGAAYHPYLRTSIPHDYEPTGVTIHDSGGATSKSGVFGGITVSFSGTGEPKVKITKGTSSNPTFAVDDNVLTIKDIGTISGTDLTAKWASRATPEATRGFDITPTGAGTDLVPSTDSTLVKLEASTLASIDSSYTGLANQIKTALAAERVILPPSAAVAGVYASVDRERGVWKAPANVGLTSTIGPVSKITNEDQESMNVDPTSGKSINAIREFTGKGTLVWGARTLAGNDNEWRYVPVRRLFNLIEESTRKATTFAVFEPNDASTWLKVKSMIDSYLYRLWQSGAFAGSTAESAYFVSIGLGKTMTAQDVLEGHMIVEIGVAAVRPAEFITLRFSHKMQEA